MISWYDGMMIWWYHDIMIWWYDDMMVWRWEINLIIRSYQNNSQQVDNWKPFPFRDHFRFATVSVSRCILAAKKICRPLARKCFRRGRFFSLYGRSDVGRNLTKISSKSRRNLAEASPKSRRGLAEVSPNDFQLPLQVGFLNWFLTAT